jgi:hypothetical protein
MEATLTESNMTRPKFTLGALEDFRALALARLNAFNGNYKSLRRHWKAQEAHLQARQTCRISAKWALLLNSRFGNLGWKHVAAQPTVYCKNPSKHSWPSPNRGGYLLCGRIEESTLRDDRGSNLAHPPSQNNTM